MAGKTGYGSRFASGAEVVFETGLAGAVFDGFGDGKKAPGPTETFDDGRWWKGTSEWMTDVYEGQGSFYEGVTCKNMNRDRGADRIAIEDAGRGSPKDRVFFVSREKSTGCLFWHGMLKSVLSDVFLFFAFLLFFVFSVFLGGFL